MDESTRNAIEAAKLAEHERLSKMPERFYIATNKIDKEDPLWHLGLRCELRYAVSNLISDVYYVSACNGRTLGGCWGYTRTAELPKNARLCPRCQHKGLKA